MMIPTARISLSVDRPPGGLWTDAVARYVVAIESGEKLEPIVVQQVGERFVIKDGAHRLEAAILTGTAELDAELQQ